ncbi:MAG: methylenetetrahydrofolate reductase [NAD(P)H] [Gammaproteobacteria bacterium]|nr:methylenetetrahydrofolate reductase [NAD(P)H] [Gammaproteobacteria bacterium]MCP5137156.1 methylenetetrahydrofolate reductase [NAD(P)H] [Gammaproteobacteria bacterium]
MESQRKHPQDISFEFFPPKTEEGAAKLRATHAELAKLNPKFFSVTFGAGGSTQERTFGAVSEILATGSDAAPHLSCIGQSRDDIRSILNKYKNQGIKRIVALRGDLPSGMGEPGELRYANELVEFIRAETGDHFRIEVAAYPEFHPQAKSAGADLDNFARKVRAGANSALTQYFYTPDAYFRFLDDCAARGLDIPVIPGIMPITNYANLARFSDACGAEIPRWLRWRLEGFGDDKDALQAFGTDVVTDLCNTLLEAGAPGLHFYTMNQFGPTLAIWQNLGLDEL